MLKQSATDTRKTASKRSIQKTAEATGDLIGDKITDSVTKSYDDEITKVSKYSPQSSSETVTNEKKYLKKDKNLQKK